MTKIYCRDLKKVFDTKRQMYTALKKNRDTLISLKKGQVKTSDYEFYVLKNGQASKEEAQNGALQMGDSVFAVINTTGYFDSHGDVHIKGIWDRSAGEQKGKVYYIMDHKLEIGKVITYPEDLDILLRDMSWKDLGRDYDGDTQALIFKVKITERGNSEATKAILSGARLQNSIRMRYVRLKLAINDQSPYFKEEYANWLEYIDQVANKDEVMEAGFFWAVLEAKIEKEGSAVLYGSNDVTPILTELKNESITDPPSGSQVEIKERVPQGSRIKHLYNLI